jgi:hypothetical protein
VDVFFLGNCQVNALKGLCREMQPKMRVGFGTITPYWGKFDASAVEAAIAQADVVVSQAIANPGARFNIAEMRERAGEKLILVPYVYVDGLAGLEIIGSKGRTVVKGAQELLLGQEGRRALHVFQDLITGKIDMRNRARVEASIARMAEKEAEAGAIRISDYLAQTWADAPFLYGINHPTQRVVFEMFRRLCDVTGWRYDAGVEADPVAWGRRALPASVRAFTSADAAALGVRYAPDSHWYASAHKLVEVAMAKAAREPRADSAA